MVNYIQISSYSGLQLRGWIIAWYDITYMIVSAILKEAASKQIIDPFHHLGQQMCYRRNRPLHQIVAVGGCAFYRFYFIKWSYGSINSPSQIQLYLQFLYGCQSIPLTVDTI